MAQARPAAVAFGERQDRWLYVCSCHDVSVGLFAKERIASQRSLGTKRSCYSALMLAPRITLPHFSVSSTMIFPYSSGVNGTVSVPSAANCDLILGSLRPAFTSVLSFSIMSAGVPLGAPNPFRRLAS